MEILAGMRPHEEERTMELLDSLENLPLDGATADQAGRLIYQYARQGIQLSFPDALTLASSWCETPREGAPFPGLGSTLKTQLLKLLSQPGRLPSRSDCRR